MIATFATVQQGETHQHTLSGRQTGDTITAKLKPAASGLGVPDDSVASVATFTTTEAAEVAGENGALVAGWILGLDATTTAALPLGSYVFDERIVNVSGQVENTEPAIIKIVNRVTKP